MLIWVIPNSKQFPVTETTVQTKLLGVIIRTECSTVCLHGRLLRGEGLVAWQVLISSSSPCFPTPRESIDPSAPWWKRALVARWPGGPGWPVQSPAATQQSVTCDRSFTSHGRGVAWRAVAARSCANYRPFRLLTHSIPYDLRLGHPLLQDLWLFYELFHAEASFYRNFDASRSQCTYPSIVYYAEAARNNRIKNRLIVVRGICEKWEE